ncbi:MAG: outer membrane beta-barrel protein, partial [Gluconacetobacter diazotrophicus]|nr:outer membrane beta-barrel protein [Gluconacetobacter diazotrophicus]
NYLTDDRYQFSILQADVTAHAPVLTAGGVDLKLGQFSTPIGFETIDPTSNPFYSHSYNFNFGPFQHTGLQAIFHVSPILDVWGQVDTGESTTFDGGDNNAEPAGLVGIGLNNLLDNKLTVLWLTHLGPDDAVNAIGRDANSSMRYESDVVLTYKATPKLTLTGEGQWQHDDYFGADSYGFAGYAAYALTPTLTANFRGEVYRDNAGFFVAAFPGNLDNVRALNGIPNRSYTAGRQTYSEWTAGVTFRPSVPHLQTVAFRPEIRWDKSFSGGHPFNALSDNGSFTLAADVMVGF